MNILICGVGGQGTLLASKVLGEYALGMGLDCKLSEVHGMAQRGGSVVTYVRMGERVFSPVIDAGGADFVLAFEKLEALRYAHYAKEGGRILYSTRELLPQPGASGECKYPSDIEQRLPGALSVDAHGLALRAGNVKAANAVMLGFFTKVARLNLEKMRAALAKAIPEKMLEVNLKAFEEGYDA